MSQHEQPTPHRLFAAIVLMGTGLAAGCGGMAERDPEASSGGEPGTGAVGTGRAGSSAGTAATTRAGGSTLDLGGSGTSEPERAPTVDPASLGPASCPPQQWSCLHNECYSAGSWLLPKDCSCDLSRPRSADDCGEGLVFLCRKASLDSDSRPLTRPVDYDCVCAPKSEQGCVAECRDAYVRGDLSCEPTEDKLGTSCACAVIYLK